MAYKAWNGQLLTQNYLPKTNESIPIQTNLLCLWGSLIRRKLHAGKKPMSDLCLPVAAILSGRCTTSNSIGLHVLDCPDSGPVLLLIIMIRASERLEVTSVPATAL